MFIVCLSLDRKIYGVVTSNMLIVTIIYLLIYLTDPYYAVGCTGVTQELLEK